MPRGDGTGPAGKKALDGAAVVAGWVAVDSEQGENAYALTAVPRLLINWV